MPSTQATKKNNIKHMTFIVLLIIILVAAIFIYSKTLTFNINTFLSIYFYRKHTIILYTIESHPHKSNSIILHTIKSHPIILDTIEFNTIELHAIKSAPQQKIVFKN